MNIINLLIKPSSSSCNIRCKYCFYHDIANNRNIKSYGKMSLKTIESIIKETFSLNPDAVVIAFQGGEPTLVGYNFYKETIKIIGIYNKKQIKVSYSIQTNGILLDINWCKFFKSNNFLVGISLDGTKLTHDKNRVDTENLGTFSRVIKSIELLKKYNVEFNILTVVNNDLVNEVEKVYNYFVSHNFNFIQFIPCLAPLNQDQVNTLSKENYNIFLNTLFDLWYMDIVQGKKISIRYFDNLVGIILGFNPQSCDLNGKCSNNLIIESNGDIYPCDFYVLDDFKIGNITDGLSNIFNNTKRLEFINSSSTINDKCMKCEFYKLCLGGCKKHKELNNEEYLNYFCFSYYNFLKRNITKLEHIAYLIRKNAIFN